MENKAQGTGSAYTGGAPATSSAQATPPPQAAGSGEVTPIPKGQGSGVEPVGTPTSGPPPEYTPEPPQKHHLKKVLRTTGIVTLALLLIGGAVFGVEYFRSGDETQQNASKQFDNTQVPLNELVSQEGVNVLGSRSLIINGQLQANEGLLVSPGETPEAPTEGQIYYDQNTNELGYYNGSQFIFVGDSPEIPASVGSIDGETGDITTGTGLLLVGGSLSNSGVVSFQGQTGAVTLSAGTGIDVSGTTVTNTGDLTVGNEITDVVANGGLVRVGAGTTVNPYQVSLQSCPSGQILQSTGGGNWACDIDDGSSASYMAGDGLQLIGNVFSVDSPTCAGTDKLQWNGTAFVCSADVDTDTDTTYTAGTGLNLVGTTFNNSGVLDVSGSGAVQSSGGQNPTLSFVDGNSAGDVWQWNGTSWVLATLGGGGDNTVGNEVTDVTGTNSGLVRSGAGTSGDPYTLAVNAGDGLQLSGSEVLINSPTCAGTDKLQWTGTAFQCAADVDTDTTYSAGTGLSLVGTTFSNTGILSVSGDSEAIQVTAGQNPTVSFVDGTVDGQIWQWNDSLGQWELDTIATSNDDAIGNEVTDVTSGTSGLQRSGSGTSGDPYTLGVIDCANTEVLQSGGAGVWGCASASGVGTSYDTLPNGGLRLVGNDFGLQVCANGELLQAQATSGEWDCVAASGVGTSYTAGNGLQLGGNEFSINSPTCSGTDKLQWTGSAFVCSADVDTDTDTTYTAGTGLSLVGTQFNNSGVLTVSASGALQSSGGQNPTIAFDDGTVDGQIWQWNDSLGQWELVDIASAGGDGVIGNEITDVTGANSGLTRSGSGTSGDPYTLAVNSSDGLQLSGGALLIDSPTCAGTDKLQWTGSAFTCSADIDTDTTYSAGTGLSLVGTTFNNDGILSLSGDSQTVQVTAGQNPTVGFVDGSADGQVWQWNAGLGQWELVDATSVGTSYTAGNGLQLASDEFSVNSPTCSGTDKLQWNGTAFVCATDVDGTGTVTLQNAYDNGNTITTSDGRNISFTLADTTTDSDFVVNLAGTGNVMQIQDNGTGVFTVADGGLTTFQTSTGNDSATAFQVLDADGGNPVFNVDTANERIGIGTNAPGAKLDLVVSDTENHAGLTIMQNDITNNPQALSIVNAGSGTSLQVTPTGNASASTSVGGAINLNNTSNTGAGLVIYSNADGTANGRLFNIRADNALFDQAAFHVDYDGTANAVEIVSNSTDASSQALNVASTNPNDSTLGINGAELDKGTVKIVHTGTGTDASASGLSIDLQGVGTASQGIFLDATDGGTTGDLLDIRNNGFQHFVLSASGAATFRNSTDSSAAFRVLDAVGASLFTVDSSNALTRIDPTGISSDASFTSGTGAIQFGSDTGANIGIDDNEIIARNNGSSSTLFLQNGGGGLTVGADLVQFQNTSNSTTAFQVLNAAGNAIATVDTTDGELELGEGANVDGTLLLRNATNSFVATLNAPTLSAHRSFTLPDESGTICTTGSVCSGYQASGSYALTDLSNISSTNLGGALNVTSGNLNLTTTTSGDIILDSVDSVGVRIDGTNVLSFDSVSGGATFTQIGFSGATEALQILDGNDVSVLNVDTANGELQLGNYNFGSNPVNGALVLANSNNAFTTTINAPNQTTGSTTISLPDTGADAADTFCLLDTGNCFGAGTGGTLQAAYEAGNTITTSDGRNISFTLADTTTDSDFVLNMAGTGNQVQFQDGGTDVFTLVDGGAATFQNSVDSADAFRVLNAAGDDVFKVTTGTTLSQDFENVTFPPSSPGTWTTGGAANWARDTGDFSEGTASAVSGNIGDSQETWLDLDVDLEAEATLTFDWQVSSEQDWDYLVVCVNDDANCSDTAYTERISGSVGWTQVSLPLESGSNSIRWKYIKDSGASSGSDEGWIDNVRIQYVPFIDVDALTTFQSTTDSSRAFRVLNAVGESFIGANTLDNEVSFGQMTGTEAKLVSIDDYALGGGNPDLDLGFTPEAGDRVIVVIGSRFGIEDGSAGNSQFVGSEWQLIDETGYTQVAYRDYTSTGSSAVDLDWGETTSTNSKGAQVFRVNGHNPDIAPEATSLDTDGLGSLAYTAPSLAPTWGDAKNLWLSTLRYRATENVTSYPAPDNQQQSSIGQDTELARSTEVVSTDTLPSDTWQLSDVTDNSGGQTHTIAVAPGYVSVNALGRLITQNNSNASSAFTVLNAGGSTVLDAGGNGDYVRTQSFENATFVPTSPGTWTTGGNTNWARDTGDASEGSASAVSGSIGDSSDSWLDLDVSLSNAGSVKFDWKVSSESDFDYLVVCVDDDAGCDNSNNYTRISGSVGWTEVELPLAAGNHSIRWMYIKDGGVSGGTDEGWVDNVRISDKRNNLTVNSAATFQNEIDSNDAFQILNAAGGVLVNVDTLNDEITFSGHVLPGTDDTYDLGSSTQRWRDLYLGPSSLHIGTDGDEGVISYNTTTDEFEFDQSLDVTGGTTINGGGIAPYELGDNWETFGSSTEFTAPEGAAIDTTNHKVYVADQSNDYIARFDSGGGGTTLGANWETFVGAVGEEFSGPEGIAVDVANNKVYVTDGTSGISRFDSGGGGTTLGANWETFAGGGGGFGDPEDVSLDLANNKAYVADYGSGYVARFDSGAGGTTLGNNWETFGGTPGQEFDSPSGVTVDSSNNKVYLADRTSDYVARFDSGGGGTTLGNSWERFDIDQPFNITVNPANDKIFVTDSTSDQLTRFDSGGGGTILGDNLETFRGSFGEEFLSPQGVAVDATNNKAYVMDGDHDFIARFDSGGGIGTAGSAFAVVNGLSETILKADTSNSQVSIDGSLHIGENGDSGAISYNTITNEFEFDESISVTGGATVNGGGIPSTLGDNWQTFTGGGGGFSAAYGVALDPSEDKAYVVDFLNDYIARFDSGGGGTTLGANWETFNGAVGEEFSEARGVAIDSVNDKVYVVDYARDYVARFDSGGGGTTLGNSWETFGGGSGEEFLGAMSVAVDVDNNKTYVADGDNDYVARFDSGGGGTTLGNNWETFGGGTGEEFSYPLGVTVDPTDNKAYAVDYDNDYLARFDSGGGGTTLGANWQTFTGGTGEQFSTPEDVALHPSSDRVYVVDSGGDYVARFDSGGGGTTLGANWETFGGGTGEEFVNPENIVLNPANDKAYVVDWNHNYIARFDTDGGAAAGSGFTVVNGLDSELFNINTSNSNITIGDSSGGNTLLIDAINDLIRIGEDDGTGALLVLDSKNTSGDPTGVAGGMYYNSNDGKFRCYENGSWKDCITPVSSDLRTGALPSEFPIVRDTDNNFSGTGAPPTTWTDTNLTGDTFTAPPSGSVWLYYEAVIGVTRNGNNGEVQLMLVPQVSDSGSGTIEYGDGNGDEYIRLTSNDDDPNADQVEILSSGRALVTGLTPGDSYDVQMKHKGNSNTAWDSWVVAHQRYTVEPLIRYD